MNSPRDTIELLQFILVNKDYEITGYAFDSYGSTNIERVTIKKGNYLRLNIEIRKENYEQHTKTD